MKIIVDSGSTKADWILLDKEGKLLVSVTSLGLNPEVISQGEFRLRVNQLADVKKCRDQVTAFYFYGSGCSSQRAKESVIDFARDYFPHLEILEVNEDTYAAVYATTQKGEEAIVCINGTGSNCCYYDGLQVHQAVVSLGYMAMDDCSGSCFGRLMIKGYYLKSMPVDLRLLFEQKYDLYPDEIKSNFYKKENPNAYLASFLPFLLQYKEHPYFAAMIEEQLQFFIDYYILQYEQARVLPIHFIGSVAYFLQDEFRALLIKNQLQVGKVFQKPLDGLLEFHQKII